jgi:hypothetical protein
MMPMFMSINQRRRNECSKAAFPWNSIWISVTDLVFPRKVSPLGMCQELDCCTDQATINSTNEFLSESRKLMNKMMTRL